MYNSKIFDHFLEPRNLGGIRNADGMSAVGDPACGDVICIYIKVKDERLVDISFLVQGCPAAIAVGSIVTEMAKGRTLEECLKITNHAVADALGGLPDSKMHCSNLGAKALHEAIKDYREKIRAAG